MRRPPAWASWRGAAGQQLPDGSDKANEPPAKPGQREHANKMAHHTASVGNHGQEMGAIWHYGNPGSVWRFKITCPFGGELAPPHNEIEWYLLVAPWAAGVQLSSGSTVRMSGTLPPRKKYLQSVPDRGPVADAAFVPCPERSQHILSTICCPFAGECTSPSITVGVSGLDAVDGHSVPRFGD
jgi:hypothetical protein